MAFLAAATIALLPGAAPAAPAGGRLRILSSVLPLRDFAAAVAGERGEAALLLPPGAGVHTWQPRPGDLARLAECDVFLHVGAGLEPWLPGLLDGLPGRRPEILEAAEGLDLLSAAEEPGVEEHGHDHGSLDPHVWLDPVLAARVVDAIAAKLAGLDPPGGDIYRRNAAGLRSRLEALDARYKERLGGCRGRMIVLAGHAAFGYLARRYGLEQVALYGASPDAQPRPSELIDIVKGARSRGVRAVFTESSVSAELAKALARELGVPVLALNPGHNLTRAEVRAGATYFSIMESNLKSLEDGLGCR